MKLFLDTSSLFKLYHAEEGTRELMDFFSHKIESLYLAEIATIEFTSVVWRKYRKKEISEEQAIKVIENFDKDAEKFRFVKDNAKLRILAKNLIIKYGKVEGLRTLDSIQLASAISVKKKVDIFLTADKLLQNLFKNEGLNTI